MLGVPLAYLLARTGGRLSAILWMLVALPIALPALMSGILLLYIVGPYTALGRLFGGALTDSPAGIILAQTFVAAPFLVIAARAAFQAVDPSLEEVARTLGHGRVDRFLRVALPAAWSGVKAGILLAWLRAFGEFGATVILAYHPYSLPVYTWVQFASTGLPTTLPPIGAALAAALVVLMLSQVPSPRRRRTSALPVPTAPRDAVAGSLSFSVAKRLRGFRLEVAHQAQARRLALLGPSGAGKTMTLRVLAGIAGAEHVRVSVGGRSLEGLDPEHRGIGYLPQDSALMPRRTVWDQVTFAVDADPGLAAWWLERLGLGGLEERLPGELSGGQQRRVALARALARGPSLLLLDEPFSALDAPVRARLHRDLRRLQREAGLTTVLVTHDPDEAATLADEVIVLDHGHALQQGPVVEVFSHPASPRVAALLGIPNTHTGTVLRPGRIRSGGLEIAAPTGKLGSGSEVVWTVRPEDVEVNGEGPYGGTVLDTVSLGAVQEITVQLGSLQLIARPARRACPNPGDTCRVALSPEAVTLWPAGDGADLTGDARAGS
ncbi:MAG TPA: ATP-binding cassette domain-containing protein [Candidatus Binatia bacterium]|nr:ATP-binding cassette domain-containing protein [Candidatus Binatia bacterium]